MTNKQKTQVSLLRAFLGYFGVDAFVMKKIPQAITRLVLGIVLVGVVVLLAVLSFTQGGTGLILATIALAVFLAVRIFLYFLGGLLMLKKSEEEIVEMYK